MKALLFSVALLMPGSLIGQQSGYAARVLEGISNRGENQGEPYVTAGDRAYLIGTQDGNFPDMGGHVHGEMGGLWVHPIKLIDGFQASARDNATGQNRSSPRPVSSSTIPTAIVSSTARPGQPGGRTLPVQSGRAARGCRPIHSSPTARAARAS